MFVHRWAISRRPLKCPIKKVGPLIMCLCRLHNYCIDAKERDSPVSSEKDATYAVQYMDALHRFEGTSISVDSELVRIENGRPNDLLHGGSHFLDAPHNRNECSEWCPMDNMMKQVIKRKLVRPTPTA